MTRPDWALFRMLVEQYTRTDVLDMTWTRFTGMLETLPALRRIQSGRRPDHAENIRQQKEQQAYEL